MGATSPITSHPGRLLAVLALGGSAYAMLQSLVVPALPTLEHDLNTTPTGVTWIFTAYLLAASVATPIAGRVGDMFGKKRTLVVVLAGLAAGTLLAALATTLPVMIGARAIQGLGGAIFPLAFGIVRDEFPRERVAGGIALISGLLGVGGGLGIILAGPILAHLDYHWLFWIPFVVIVGDRRRDDGDHPRVAGPCARQRQLGGRDPALGLADLPPRRDQRGSDVGLALGADARPPRRGRRARLRLDPGRDARDEPARRHDDDAPARGLDDEPGRLPARSRDVQRVRPHPPVRADADEQRVRVRLVGDAGRPLPDPEHPRDDDREPPRRAPVGAVRLEGAARAGLDDHDVRVHPPRRGALRALAGLSLLAAARRRGRLRVRVDGEPDRRGRAARTRRASRPG